MLGLSCCPFVSLPFSLTLIHSLLLNVSLELIEEIEVFKLFPFPNFVSNQKLKMVCFSEQSSAFEKWYIIFASVSQWSESLTPRNFYRTSKTYCIVFELSLAVICLLYMPPSA